MLFLKTNCKEGETRRNETKRSETKKEDPFPTGNEPSDIFNSK